MQKEKRPISNAEEWKGILLLLLAASSGLGAGAVTAHTGVRSVKDSVGSLLPRSMQNSQFARAISSSRSDRRFLLD